MPSSRAPSSAGRVRPMKLAFLFCAAAGALGSSHDAHPLCDERFLFHQLLSRRDVARPEEATGPAQRKVFAMAKAMQNFMYLVGDRVTRECVVIDACSGSGPTLKLKGGCCIAPGPFVLASCGYHKNTIQ